MHFSHRREHRFGVVGEVPTLSVQALARDVRRANALISRRELGFFRELFEFFDNGRAAREPHRQAGTDVVVENEELQFLAKLAMIALLRFLEHREVVVELLFCFEGGAVNALELRILLVAFIVSARDAGELERADVSGAHDMRPGAKVDEVAVAIERDRSRPAECFR